MADAIISHKTCSACNQCKPIELFGKAAAYRDGHRGQCNSCRVKHHAAYAVGRERAKTNPAVTRRTKLKQRYGMTEDDYAIMLAAQGGCCAVCNGDSPGGRWQRFHVDHCHSTGEIRGLLCHACNVTLGAMGDSINGVMRYVTYLTKRKLHEDLTS